MEIKQGDISIILIEFHNYSVWNYDVISWLNSIVFIELQIYSKKIVSENLPILFHNKKIIPG